MRNIYTVYATQIVVSESNPQGIPSNVSGYPVAFDSRSYKATSENPNGDEGIALLAAQAKYAEEIVTLANANNSNRVGWAVWIIRGSDGKQIANKSDGGFPDMTPPEPEPEPEPEETEEQ